MGKKVERVFRTGRLTPAEAARDAAIRQELEREFPPRAAGDNGVGPTTECGDPLSKLLRQAIQESGRSVDDVARQACVSPTLVAQFLSGTRDIHMATADKLAGVVELRINVN